MKGSNTKKKNYVVILLIVFLLALAVGYAAFGDTLTITGTATANGTFDVNFISCEVKNAIGVNTDETKGVINDDTLTVTVADLAYPGAGAQFDVVIKNEGTAPAKIKSITPTNIEGSEDIIISGLEAITEEHETIAVNGTCSFSFTVQWDPNSTDPLTDESVSFGLVIEYEQDTESFIGTTSHTDA